eukprot:scaffold3262_cov204-Pinguiococcus_pyrenoidosus.AAC.2
MSGDCDLSLWPGSTSCLGPAGTLFRRIGPAGVTVAGGSVRVPSPSDTAKETRGVRRLVPSEAFSSSSLAAPAFDLGSPAFVRRNATPLLASALTRSGDSVDS